MQIKNSIPKEKEICKAFYNQYQSLKLYKQFDKNVFVFHIANEQNCSKYYTMELKRMGLTGGVADYCVLYEGGKVAFIEFKRNGKCKLTKSQEYFKDICLKLGIPFLQCSDSPAAITFIQNL